MLAALMLCSMLPATVFALGNNSEYLCGHVHDASCGYTEGREGTPCTHAHDSSCGYVEGSPCTDVHVHNAGCGYIEGAPCTYSHTHDESCGYCEGSICTYEHLHNDTCGYNFETGEGCTDVHTHDASCGFAEASPCTDAHVHNEDCGYIEAAPCTYSHTHDENCGYIEAVACNHVHDASCGYSEPVLAAPCSHICEILSFSDYSPGEAVSTYEAELGDTYDDVCAALPEALPGTLACAGGEVDIPLRWSCADYSAEPGTYTFRAELDNAHCAYAAIDNELTEDVDESELPFITVTVAEAAAPTEPPVEESAPSIEASAPPVEASEPSIEASAPPVEQTPELGVYTITDDAQIVTVTGPMPEGARLEVRALTEEELAAYVAEGVNVVFAYDIKIMVPDGEGEVEYQPTAESPVTVTITPPEPIAAPTVEVVHIAVNEVTGEPTQQPVATVTLTENTIEFEAEGFSIYIGTTPPTLVDVSELYYNGSGFFTDAACTAANQVKDADEVPFTDMQTLINHVAGDLTIYMTATYTVSGTQSITGGTVYNVTLKRHSGNTDALITVPSDGGLTLSNITIDGGAVWSNADPATRTNSGLTATAAAVIVDGGELTLNSGAVVQNNYNTASSGGGVSVNSGTFTMSGGSVSDNMATAGNGGGVYLASADNTFTMNGGTISGNTAKHYGGGVFIYYENLTNLQLTNSFTMNGGTISGNTAGGGGGVFAGGGRFTMNGGTVSGNTASSGGGVFVRSNTFNMSGGTVSGNTATNSGGGVVVQDGGTFNMSGGTVIDNTATNSGGVYASGTTNMTGGTANPIAGNVTDGTNPVTRHTITLVDGASPATTPVMAHAAVTALSLSTGGTYGITDVKTDASGKLYIWLPDGITVSSVSAGGKTFTGTSVAGEVTSFYSTGGYIFVNGSLTTGNNDGTTAANAFKTFSEALTIADGKTIVVCGPTEIAAEQTVSANVTITSVHDGTDYRASANAQLKRGTGYTTGALLAVDATGSLTLQDVTVDGGVSVGGELILSGSVDLRETISLAQDKFITVAAGGLTPAGPLRLELDAAFTADCEVVRYTAPIADAAAELAKFSLTAPTFFLARGTGDNAQKLLLSSSDGAVYLNGADGNDANNGSTPALAVKTLKAAYEKLANGGVIYICGQVTITGVVTLSGTSYSGTDGNVSIANGFVSICRYSQPTAHSGDWQVSYTGTLLSVQTADASLTLGNIELNGHRYATATAPAVEAKEPLVEMESFATLNVNDGAVLKNNNNTTLATYVVGGVDVTGGTFNMTGGTISGNAAVGCGGVYVKEGTFTLIGGTISGNTASSSLGVGGGGVGVKEGTLTMSGGTISGNTATGNGGGVLVNGSTFTMSGGTISGNTATDYGGGVYAKSSTFNMSGGTVSGNTATRGGVYVNENGTFNMSGGTVSGNTDNFGDVCVNTGNITMSGGTAQSVRSVHSDTGTVTVIGGSVSTISNTTPNDGTTTVTLHTITLVDGASPANTPVMADTAVTALSLTTGGTYGITDVKTDASGKLYIWLPAGTRVSSVSAGGKTFTGMSASGAVTSFYSSVSSIFVNGSIAASGDGTTAETAYKTFAEALANDAGKTIVVCGPTDITAQQNVSANVTITSVHGGTDYRASANAQLKRGAGHTGYLFNVTGSLTLQNVTVDGGAVWSATDPATRTNSGITASASAINVSAGGFLGLNSGAVVQNNHYGSDNGTGGAVNNSGTFTINGGTLSDNSASGSGGAVYSTGLFTLSSGTLSGNSSSTADGGGVYIFNGSFNMSGGTISGNTAKFGGGGVYTHNTSSSFTMSGGTISGNAGNGGGVYVCAGSRFTMSGGEISGNTGGGVMVFYNAVFTMNGGTVSDSTTGNGVQLYGDGNGGGTFNMNGGTVSGNNGNGVFVYTNGASANCSFNMSGGTISGNTVNGTTNGVRVKVGDFTLSGSPDLQDTVSLGEGQHITVATGGFTPTGPLKLVLDAEFTTNSEVVSYAGSITDAAAELAKFSLLSPGCSLVQGTGDNAQKLLLVSSGRAVYLNGGGGLDTNDGSTPALAVKTLKVAYEKLTSTGGVIYICGQVTVTGAITLSGTSYSGTDGTANITDGSVSLWRYSQPTANTGWQESYTGILISVQTANASLTLGNIELNGHRYATATAPAVTASASLVKVESGATLTVNAGAALRNNNNTANGGGVYVNDGALDMRGDAGITNNTANYGGGVYVTSTDTFTMNSGTISGNTASCNGGGVYASNSTVTMVGGTVSNNTAGDNGGGVYANTCTVTMSDGSISGNTAENGGGVFVLASGKKFTMTGGTVSDNTATDGNGGGVFVSSGTFDMSAGYISGNTATGNGGGVYVNSAFTLSGSPSLADEVYLQQGKSITVNAAFTPAAPVPVAGEGFTLGRAVATYGESLTPDAAKFSLSDAAYSLTASGQSIVIIQSPPQGTVTAAGEGVALGEGQSKTYTLPLSGLFATGTTIRISKVTATPAEGGSFTHEAYNTVYQNRRNYGYTKANSTFGLSVTKTGGTETDSYAADYTGGIPLGTVAAGDTLTFTVYNANAITDPNPAGSLTVTLSDGTNTVDVAIYINRRSDVQLNVTVPIQISASMDAAGTFTFGNDYAIENYSNVPVNITSMSWAWAEDNASLFVDNTKLSASISLGSNTTPYSFTYSDLTRAPGTDGRIIAYNGILPGRLPLHWSLLLGEGNALKSYPGDDVSVQIATVTYTINVAEGELTGE